MDSIDAKFGIVGSNLQILENVRIWVDDENRILEIEELDKEINNNLVLMPGLFNAHVHAADIGLRGVESGDLRELVGRDGIKHRYLKELTKENLRSSLNLSFQEAIHSGTLGWSDFREGGNDGMKPYPLNNSRFHLAFGRPRQNEINDLSSYPNIGIMDVQAYPENEMRSISKNINREIQKLFIHASESLKLRNSWISDFGTSDIIWAIDVLNPDAIIHATHADEEDITQMYKSKTGVVICLRSNEFTRAGTPPIKKLIESKLKLGIGTDNAMFNRLSLWEEISELKNHINPDRLFSIATVEGASLCGIEWGISVGNSNFLEFRIPNDIRGSDIKKWIINNGTEKDILEIWR